MPEFFDYVYTTKELDFKKYLSYAGLELTQTQQDKPEPYFGLTVRQKNDTLFVTKVEWESPAWKNNIRTKDVIISINGDSQASDMQKTIIKDWLKDHPIK